MPSNNTPLDDMNLKVNTVVGLKQYKQVKKVMQEFKSQLRQDNDEAAKVDRKVT